RPGVYCTDAAPRAFPQDVQRHSSDRWHLAPLDLGRNEIKNQRVFNDLDPPIGRDRGYQSALDLSAGGVATGMGDAMAHVAALPGQLQLPGKITIELCAAFDELGHLIGPFGNEHPYGFLDAETRACDQGVVNMLLNC